MEDVEDGSTGQIDTINHPGEKNLAEGSQKRADPNVLGEVDIEGKLKEIRGKVPSFILNDIKKSLIGRTLTSQQLSKIIERTLKEYHEKNKGNQNTGADLTAQLAEMNEKIEMLVNATTSPVSTMSPVSSMPSRDDAGINVGGAITATAGDDNAVIDDIREQIDGIPPEKILFGDDNGNAKLHDIPEDVVSIMISLKWLEFLIEKAGLSNIPDVLEFYCDLNWISEKALSRLMRYSKGTKPLNEDPKKTQEEKLSAKDHIMSLLFIERLRGNKISPDVLEQLERELKKIRRGAEELYGV